MMDMVIAFNLKTQLEVQDHKCLLCGKKLGDRVYYNLDQEKDINEVYCVTCAEELGL